MEVFEKILDYLNGNGIEYRHKEHEPTLTSEDSARIRGDDLSQGAKAIVFKIQDSFCLFVFAADKRINTKMVKTYFKNQGKKVKKTRFATSEELLEITGLVPGSVPPFGRPILDFDLFVDPSLLENSRISFNAGSLTNSLNISLQDYMKVCGGEVFEFCESYK